jgi:DNA polymerase-3 subunit epsilon
MIEEGYLSHFEETWTADTPVSEVRFVVLDTETTGLDPRRDRLITIGAIAVEDSEICLDESFEAMLKLDYNRSSVKVHGITRDEASDGMNEPEALELFLAYLRDGVIVGHHIGHDIQMLNTAYERHFGFRLRNRSLDTMDLTLHLRDDGVFAAGDVSAEFTLDSLCEMFRIAPHDRHTAGGDAFLTALVFLRLLRAARKAGRFTVGSISAAYCPGGPS